MKTMWSGQKKYNGYTCYKCKTKFIGEDKFPACSNANVGFDQCEKCFGKQLKQEESQ